MTTSLSSRQALESPGFSRGEDVNFLVEMVLWPMDIVVRLLLMVVGFILTPVTRQINKPLAENRHRRSGR